MDWIVKLFTEESIAQTIVVYGLTISIGLLLGRVKIAGISLGVTWILFAGLFISYMGIHVNAEMKDLFKEFGLILFVYTVGLQVGPGFFASLKKGAFANNGLAITTVALGILLTIILYFSSPIILQ